MKIYEILIEKKDLFDYKLEIKKCKKLNNKDDNKFLIYLSEIRESKYRDSIFLYDDDLPPHYESIILSELTENINLKIINQSYFTEKDNKFYKGGYCISIY